jgi:hypothetical protein
MEYHVIYTTPHDRRRWSTTIDVQTDAEAMHVAIALLPPGAVLDQITEMEIPMAA